MDDFGSGYSSLGMLKDEHVDELKIDKTFVDDIVGSSVNAAILGSIIQMAHGLELTVVAEGVETEGQRNELIRQGCDLMQGYLFSKPVLENEFCRMLTKKA